MSATMRQLDRLTRLTKYGEAERLSKQERSQERQVALQIAANLYEANDYRHAELAERIADQLASPQEADDYLTQHPLITGKVE